jgi:hypothetical protein
MSSKGVEINVIPSFVAPFMVILDVVTVVITINVKSDTLVILTRDRNAIYVEGDLLVVTMSYGESSLESTMLTIPSSKKVSIDVETSSQGKLIVCHCIILMSTNPDRSEWTS